MDDLYALVPMATLDEIRDAVIGAMRSRLDNPFVGGFVLSWIAINWKYVYVTVFVSADRLPRPYVDKLTFLLGIGHGWCELLLIPGASGLAISAVLPALGAVSSLMSDGVKQAYRRIDKRCFKTKYHERDEVDQLVSRINSLDSEVIAHRNEKEAFEINIKNHEIELRDAQEKLKASREGADNLVSENAALKANLAKLGQENANVIIKAESDSLVTKQQIEAKFRAEISDAESRLKRVEDVLRIERTRNENERRRLQEELADTRQQLERSWEILVQVSPQLEGASLKDNYSDTSEWWVENGTILQEIARSERPFELLFPGIWERYWSVGTASDTSTNKSERFSVRVNEYQSDQERDGLVRFENFKAHSSFVTFDLRHGDRSTHVQLSANGPSIYRGFEWRDRSAGGLVSVTYRKVDSQAESMRPITLGLKSRETDNRSSS